MLPGPVEEVQDGAALIRLRLGLLQEDEGGGGDRPGLGTVGVGEGHTHALHAVPLGVGGGSGEGVTGRLQELASLILELGPGEVVLLRVGVFDVTDRVIQLTDVSGNTFVALAALAHRPLHSLAGTDLRLPVSGDLGEVVGPEERGAGTVSAVDHNDRGGRKLEARVQLRDLGVIPHLDLAEEDVGENGTGQTELASLDAGDVNNRNRAADDGRELHELMLLKFSGGHRIVRGTEVNRTRDNLALTAAGADGLIVHLVTGSSLVVRSPLGINGVGERSAGTGNRGSVRDGERRGSDKGGESDSFERLESDHFRVCNQLKNWKAGMGQLFTSIPVPCILRGDYFKPVADS